MSFNVLILFICCFFVGFTYIYFNRKLRKLSSKTNECGQTITDLGKQLEELNNLTESQKNVILSQRAEINTQNVGIQRLQEKTTTVESQKKSSEVRLGQMAENFMPFIRDYPYNHKNFRFLANPVDGIQVEPDAVIFVEFKTGSAKLSNSQKHIKDLVGQGKVRFETFRVDEKGTHLKLESNMENVT
jgi:predicted Holliday junction resolvase-like endonuclease